MGWDNERSARNWKWKCVDDETIQNARYLTDIKNLTSKSSFGSVYFAANRLKAHIDFSASKHNYPAAYSVQRISWNYCTIFFIMTLTEIIKIFYDWYQKPTSSGRYLNYFSQYSLCQKIGIIVSLIDRILLLSHPSFHAKNFDKIIRITRRILKTRSKHRNHINRKTKDQLS